jgi:hypothetical protein
LLLVDAMAGQDAVNVANAFNSDLRLTGVIMSKLDGDAKGGAALSIKYLTGLPIKFAGVGEKLTDLDIFYPDRMASRILGMGDVVSLVEKAQEVIDQKEAEKASKKMMDGDFTLEDMLKQMKMVQKIGSLGAIAKMIPGMPNLSDEQKEKAQSEMKVFESIVYSMTPYERRHPEVLEILAKEPDCQRQWQDQCRREPGHPEMGAVQRIDEADEAVSEVRENPTRIGRDRMADINAEFLDLYNHLDEAIRGRYQLEDRTSSAIAFLATKFAHATSPELNALGEALDSIRQLRNTLVHVEKVEGQELVVVNPLLVEKLKEAILYVEKPPRGQRLGHRLLIALSSRP